MLRIDSPGGSALASALVAREVFATRTAKPIVCSMSNVAASGGYFIAAGCDTIYAEPMTITGSIGIFFGKFDLSGLAHQLGISTQTYRRGQRADIESMFRPYTDEERAVLLDKLRYMYGRFVGAVAEGRKLTKAEVDAVGRGHVFTGAAAKAVQLVDRFGGVGDALDDVKHRLGLDADDHVHILELPTAPPSVFGWLGNLVGADSAAGRYAAAHGSAGRARAAPRRPGLGARLSRWRARPPAVRSRLGLAVSVEAFELLESSPGPSPSPLYFRALFEKNEWGADNGSENFYGRLYTLFGPRLTNRYVLRHRATGIVVIAGIEWNTPAYSTPGYDANAALDDPDVVARIVADPVLGQEATAPSSALDRGWLGSSALANSICTRPMRAHRSESRRSSASSRCSSSRRRYRIGKPGSTIGTHASSRTGA